MSVSNAHLLWIDCVGTFLVVTGKTLSVGGRSADRHTARSGVDFHLGLASALSAEEFVLERSGDRVLVRPGGTPGRSALELNGASVREPTLLTDGDLLRAGQSVELRVRQPSRLTPGWRLEVSSGHQPAVRIEAVVWCQGVCLLGPGLTQHVVCRDWTENVVLYQTDQEWRFRCGSAPEERLHTGAVVSAGDCHWRWEPWPTE